MNMMVTVILTNEQGWQKRFPLEEGVFAVGSTADARIRLPDADGISPYHLQLVNSSREACMRLVNLSPWALPLKSGAQDLQVGPGQLRDVFDGETIYLDGMSMQFEIHKRPVQTEVVKEENRSVIGLRMVLSGQVLYPGGTLTGTLYLRNLGERACQFDVELNGLPPECYEISPPALIHAGGEESTLIHFFHRKIAPNPGVHAFDLRVSAPDAYPGHDLTVRQSIKIMPCYEYHFGFDAPGARGGRGTTSRRLRRTFRPKRLRRSRRDLNGSRRPHRCAWLRSLSLSTPSTTAGRKRSALSKRSCRE